MADQEHNKTVSRTKSQGSSVERSGAAQGLAEVLAVLGPAQLEALLPDILKNCTSRNAFAREGHLTLFKFLPAAVPQLFQVTSASLLPLAEVSEQKRQGEVEKGRWGGGRLGETERE